VLGPACAGPGGSGFLVTVEEGADEAPHQRDHQHQKPYPEHYYARDEESLGSHHPHNHNDVQKTDHEKTHGNHPIKLEDAFDDFLHFPIPFCRTFSATAVKNHFPTCSRWKDVRKHLPEHFYCNI